LSLQMWAALRWGADRVLATGEVFWGFFGVTNHLVQAKVRLETMTNAVGVDNDSPSDDEWSVEGLAALDGLAEEYEVMQQHDASHLHYMSGDDAEIDGASEHLYEDEDEDDGDELPTYDGETGDLDPGHHSQLDDLLFQVALQDAKEAGNVTDASALLI